MKNGLLITNATKTLFCCVGDTGEFGPFELNIGGFDNVDSGNNYVGLNVRFICLAYR